MLVVGVGLSWPCVGTPPRPNVGHGVRTWRGREGKDSSCHNPGSALLYIKPAIRVW